jgi:hypothetical protein
MLPILPMHLRDDKFLVSCAARSGSTMLCTLIRSHPQAICHGEVLAQERPPVSGIYGRKSKDNPEFGRQIRRYRDEQPQRFLYDIVFNPQGRRCVGFKFKTDEAFQPRFEALREVIAADKDIKVIHLIRRNLLDQYVSHRVVEKTGLTFLRPTDARPEVAPFTVDIDHFIAYVKDVNERQQAANDLYRDHRSLVLTYEDIVAPQSSALDDLQTFLGIDTRPLSTPLLKIIRNNSEMVLNLKEVQAALACERAGKWLSALGGKHAEAQSLEA